MSRRPANAVLIGLGMVADMHAAAIAATGGAVRLSGVMARRVETAEAFAARHGGPPVLSSVEAVIATRPDFVILATPPDTRHVYVAGFAEAGIPVLTEKPLARTYAEAAQLVALCEARGVPFGAVLQHRMRPAAQELTGRVAAGEIGEIASVEMRIPWWRDQSYYDAPGRGTYDRDGGGVLITQAIHTMDLMLQLCGPVEAVQAMTATTALHQLEAEDFAAAALRFRSGAVGSMVASVTHFPGGAEEIVLNGTSGSAVLAANRLVLHRHGGAPEQIGEAAGSGGGADPMAFSHDWHRDVIADFATAVATGRAPAIPARSALEVHALIDAITRSAQSGRREEVADV